MYSSPKELTSRPRQNDVAEPIAEAETSLSHVINAHSHHDPLNACQRQMG